MNVAPRHVICALGDWSDLSQIVSVVQSRFNDFEISEEFTQLSPDPRMPSAFTAYQDRLPSTILKADRDSIRDHRAVAYVLSPPMTRETSEAVSGQALLLIAELFRNRATAVKSESAGVAHGRKHWIKLAADYDAASRADDEFGIGAALYHAWVQRGISDSENIVYSVGMHLLGHRDIEVSGMQGFEAVQWIDLLGLHLMADKPDREIKDGEGLRLVADGPRRIIQHFECTRYSDDDFSFNPYGYNRLVAVASGVEKKWWRFW